MRLPEVSDRLRDVPVGALRLVFAGIGRVLLAVDRSRGERAGTQPESAMAGSPKDGGWRA